MTLLTTRALAYVNFGRWVADCPLECGSASALEPHQQTYHCIECGHIGPVEWPKDADEIWEALGKRRFPKNRNWYPQDHPVALAAHCPHGQTPKELEAETIEHGG